MKVTSFDLRRFLALALVILTSGVLTVRAEVLLTALEGTKGVKDTENYQMMFDGKLDTKWCVTNFTEAYVIVRASEKIAPRMYSMVTGGDIELHPYRNWKRWRIYGANFDAPEQAVRNAEEWTLIDQKQDIGPDMLPPINTFTVSFTLSEPNDTPYEYFRIEVDEVLNVPVAQNVMMMTEFSFDEIRKVGYTALDGVAGFGAAEGYASLVDGLSSTKWCSNVGDWWIIFRSDEPIAPAYYCLVTGNDTYTNQGRNWTAWEIYGGNFTADDQATRDAKGWTVLDERKEVGQDRLPVTNLTEAYFGISGSGTKYQYFMVHVSGIVGGNIQQMSELTFGEAATLPRVIAQYTDELKQYSLDFTADAALKQAYEQKMGELQTCKDLEVALSLYADIKALQVELNLSRNAYETYIKTVEYLLTYVDEHPQMSAQGKQLIQQYTQERVEPNANFPRGSYPYIMELMNLSVTDLNEEVDYLYQLLEQYGSSTSGYIETTLETFDGTVGVKDAENFPGLTDGETTTKWCVRPYVKGDCYAIIKAGDPIRPTFYSLSTANDTQSNPGRNWKAWRIFAANFDTEEEATRESSKWQLIDTKTNIGTDQLPTTNYTTVYFYLDQAPAEGCTYFKIEVDEIASGDIMQMSEFQFFNQGNLMQLRNEYYELFESVFDLDEIVAQQSLVDEYRQKLSELQKVTNMNSMGTLHSRLTELKPLIEQSMAAYEAYIEAAEEAIQELDISTLTGPGAEFLKAYLEEDIAPDTPYPNGSYPYIMRTRALDVQTIQRETTYLRNLLEGALNGSAAALRGTAGYGPEEGPAALVDGNEATKWAGTFQDEAYIVFKTASPQQPFFYTLVTGNDANRYPGRNWKDWSIYGANFQSDDDAVRQAEAWTLIDQKTGIGLDRIPDTNFTPCWFGLSEQMTELYQYFMVVVTKVANGSAQQMSELTWGDEADFQDIKSAQYDAADYFLYQHELSEQRLQDTYQDKMEAMNDAQDMETFVSFLHEIQSLQSRLRVSNQTYQEYIALIDELRTFLKENEIDAPILDAYTSGSEEPNDLFPNGNYEYIIEIHELNQSDLVAEMERVKQMWADAIRQTDKSVEVTELLTNPTFANGFSGWEGQPGTETGSTNEGRPFAAISKNQAFNLHQQLTGLRNGYYMLTANALYRPHDEAISTDYAAFLYANEVVNYIQSACEDLVTDETAIDGENCYLASDLQVKDEYGEFIGYAPNSVRTMAYAIKGGRYQNAVLVQVTDGTLTVGLYDQGTIQGNDWTAFGNVRLYYLGSDGDEARMMDALSTYRARSESLLRYMPDVVDYKRYPNFSQELRDRLSALNRELDTSNGLVPDRLVAMAGEYAAIFQEIMDSKRAYVSLMNTAELLYARVNADDSGLSEEEINQVNELIPDVWEKWEDGAYTTEEAWQQSDLVDNNVYRRLFGTRPQMAGGIYQIGNPEELRWMAIAVNGGDNGISACLTSDIDLQTLESSLPVIGTNDNPFRGKFDGQGHAIHNFMLEATSSIAGLFGKIQNADVRSFSIDGQLTCISASNGPVAYADASTISDVHSSLNIVAIRPGVTHTGGIAGECQNGTIVSRCSYDGTMTVDGNNNDCFGGICGYTNTSRLDNCAFYGKLTFNNSGCFAGGILGYINNTSCQGPHNCLSVGQVQYVANIAIQPSYAGAIIGWMRGYNANLIGENWYLEGSAPAASGAATLDKFHAVNAQQMTSGQTCYLLNSGQAEQPWRQTLGQDDTPVLDQTHLKVYLASDGSYTNEETTTHSGTQDDPFVVKTASDLSNLRNLLVSGRMNYVVMEADVDMEGVTDWIPLFDIADQSAGYPFIDFDGKGHVILNLTSQDPTRWYNGLFGVLCGNVRNLGMENANILSEASGTGIISGYLGHSTYGKPCYVENVWATGNVKVTQGYCGGLFGTIADVSHIKNCYARVSVTGADGAAHTTGGIIGRVRGMVDMQNVYAAGTINQGGGIIGGGHADNTPGGTYNNIVVWNNTSQTFGNTIADDRLNGISYYDGSNFAQLQQTVVSWDSNVWFCDMAEGSYPVLAGFTGIGSVATQPDAVGAIYDLQGRHIVGKPVRGLYIINGRKMLVK